MDGFEKQFILNALNEDVGEKGDLTSECLIEKDFNSTFKLIVNEDAILAGLEVFTEIFKLLDKNVFIKSNYADGSEIKKNNIIATIQGNCISALKAERTALNFISHLSGDPWKKTSHYFKT